MTEGRLVVYRGLTFRLEHDPATGYTVTHYAGDRWSGCAPHADDQFHGDALGITAKEHRLLHELLHHLVSIAYYGSEDTGVIFRDAHAIPQTEPESELEEWMVTALTYRFCGRDHDTGAITDLERAGVNVDTLLSRVGSLTTGVLHV